jgi:hypothetical protein
VSEAASIFLAVSWRGIAVCLTLLFPSSKCILFKCTVCQGSSAKDFGTTVCLRATNLVVLYVGAAVPL